MANEPQKSDDNGQAAEAVVTDDEIVLQDQQLKTIEDEQKSVPLVATLAPFSILCAEYDNETSAAFLSKATELSEVYGEIRYIRGDGNCFYRAILVGLIEIMLKDRARLEKFIASSRDWTRTLVELGFPDWTCTDFCDFFIEFLEKIHSGVHTEEAVYTILNDDGSANYILMFFRLITSAFLKQNSEEYAPFIDEGMTVAQYCEQEIEPMWKDADHLAINSLIKAAGTRVRIEYMDRTAAPNGGWHYDIPSDDQQIAPEITLLYRPGHYDVIYKKDSTEASEIEN
ncbi:Ubiquitin thioesterase otubain-like [Caenorhabditis elegans]|uniref:Ubiquitin thioesterase otubain-like n=1 Tax=Caenorhabditis elegans TaxID=6239 RepID=OTUBL_CAEEL|nr:Ubiquitin thioesterase otubain-like [Caenorhabditis elegans]Q9XVR6.1 RecName: Full=Ubiquitin thioesterase otubain-like; AltName: Full=Deubiquitinating enzyme otubain-like; AltName: Full=Ubiquitin-specific-processing protease otubain-like [Caenorhabditis elegans]4DHI_B Chain B, Ubiquitin thioesterase otubain-like [Caenorhabditis elegans]4DHJ_A Chain A, Ubiquitin thioesterase otubain-like [Caenorhabditis elegans]4DHJ_E Chain E, Ubiquitin thioesterase otubain-like [Caenorhabditis elegans]4DHJ_|eukprot:NP_506709.1 Ubiquitin thioesterase otubain-like [Caenorhabditis elegans]